MAFEDYAINATTGDVDIDGSGNILQSEGKVRIMAQVQARLSQQKGEWLLDESSGPDWKGRVFVKSPHIATIRALLSAEILAVPGVFTVPALDLTIDGARNATITFTARTIAGTIEGSITI